MARLQQPGPGPRRILEAGRPHRARHVGEALADAGRHGVVARDVVAELLRQRTERDQPAPCGRPAHARLHAVDLGLAGVAGDDAHEGGRGARRLLAVDQIEQALRIQRHRRSTAPGNGEVGTDLERAHALGSQVRRCIDDARDRPDAHLDPAVHVEQRRRPEALAVGHAQRQPRPCLPDQRELGAELVEAAHRIGDVERGRGVLQHPPFGAEVVVAAAQVGDQPVGEIVLALEIERRVARRAAALREQGGMRVGVAPARQADGALVQLARVQRQAAHQRPARRQRRVQRQVEIGALVRLVGERARAEVVAGRAGRALGEVEVVAQGAQLRAQPTAVVVAMLHPCEQPPVALARRRGGEPVGVVERQPGRRSGGAEGHRPGEDGVAAGVAQEAVRARIADRILAPAHAAHQRGGGRGRPVQAQLGVALRPRPRPLGADPVSGQAVGAGGRLRPADRHPRGARHRSLDHVVAVGVAGALVPGGRERDAQPAVVAPAVDQHRAALVQAAGAHTQLAQWSVGRGGDEVDHAAHRGAPVQRRIGAAHDLDALHAGERDAGDVDAAGERGVHRLAVDHHQRARRARNAAQRQHRLAGAGERRAHGGAADIQARHVGQRVARAHRLAQRELLGADHGDAGRHPQRRGRRAGGGHHHLLHRAHGRCRRGLGVRALLCARCRRRAGEEQRQQDQAGGGSGDGRGSQSGGRRGSDPDGRRSSDPCGGRGGRRGGPGSGCAAAPAGAGTPGVVGRTGQGSLVRVGCGNSRALSLSSRRNT